MWFGRRTIYFASVKECIWGSVEKSIRGPHVVISYKFPRSYFTHSYFIQFYRGDDVHVAYFCWEATTMYFFWEATPRRLLESTFFFPAKGRGLFS